VVLLDLRLPDSSGAETFLSLRDRAAGVPVVILSAADDEAQALQLIQEGAENYLGQKQFATAICSAGPSASPW